MTTFEDMGAPVEELTTAGGTRGGVPTGGGGFRVSGRESAAVPTRLATARRVAKG